MVRRLKGVGEVSGDWREHTIAVEYDPGLVTAGAIQEIMATVGYESTVVEG